MKQAEWTIFISYSRADTCIVRPLTELIRVTGVGAFRDEDSIQKGKRWQMVISDSILACRTLIVFWSTAASTSSAVATEYKLAIELNKDVVPVLLDGTVLAEALRDYQWIDLREIFISHRRKRPRATGIGAALGAAIGLVLGMGAMGAGAIGFGLDTGSEFTMNEAEKRSFIAALEARITKVG